MVGPPQYPPRPPSAPLGGTFPITSGIHPWAVIRDLSLTLDLLDNGGGSIRVTGSGPTRSLMHARMHACMHAGA